MDGQKEHGEDLVQLNGGNAKGGATELDKKFRREACRQWT